MVEEKEKKEKKEELEKPEGTVTMPVKEFENLKKMLVEMRDQQSILMSIADKKALALYYQRNKEKLPAEVNLLTMNGKVIIGWQSKEDEGEFLDPLTGKRVEIQRTEVLFEDGTTSMMPLVNFYRLYKTVICKVMGETTDTAGNLLLKLVRLDNNKEYTVGVQFVN